MTSSTVLAPVSLGELLDKISILEIKESRIVEESKLVNVRTELCCLCAIRPVSLVGNLAIEQWVRLLREANTELWDLEDRIRDKERAGEFDDEFVEIARLIYRTNDKRAHAKKMINTICGSQIVEEKSYQPYDD
ncbi:DUF4254 domain-containing protein [Synechococcus sp. CS-1325]|uniref:DUF4254 domain-containing protein n=1 Tax=Synechococcus sp. CS-1325 TaxID=2847979 RepID=UPI000DB2A8F5|nr:DUF4254 domain-containing protein [Synechococcus sp. CS-1325]MCT0199555.1 DUF4254 domain-containing protein [Synechococcus sp. CS-1325]PZV01941.1 MAG: hypothetical protein DCF24_03195 [Cyanobium sp.]